MSSTGVINGLVLAGGHSRRFGSDKAAVQLSGESLLQRTVSLLQEFCVEVRVSVRADQSDDALRSAYPLLFDAPGIEGPPAALLAAAAEASEHAWLIVACDLPRLDRATLAGLVAARDPARPATALRSPVDGLPEPLCAIYEPAGLASFKKLTARGRLSPRDFLIEQAALSVDPPLPEALINMNRPADLADLKRKELRP
jgi:molybdopterin-guanine dinucleotide biosynthesis protein A